MKRAALGSFLVVAVMALVGLAPAALAHTELILSTPQDGAMLEDVPTEVVLTFSEDLLPDVAQVSVSDETGMVIRVGDPQIDGSDVTIAWPPGLPGSDFDVNYRVVSQDGHPVSGTISFTADAVADASPSAGVASAPEVASPSPVAAPSPSDDGAALSIVGITLGIALAITIGVLLILRRRGSVAP